MPAYRSPWFRFWVYFISESILRAENLTLRYPSGRWDALARLWVAFRLSWLYHRSLDLAGIGLSRKVLHEHDEVECSRGNLCADCLSYADVERLT